MEYIDFYASPLGTVLLTGDGEALTGLRFEEQDSFSAPTALCAARELPVFVLARRWLDLYFSGREPDFLPPLALRGTPFRRAVWELLLTVPYGTSVSYGALAKQLSLQSGFSGCSPRAVGAAVSRNPIWLMIPCHRVIGSDGSLTGYAGGLARKRRLLELEGIAYNETKAAAAEAPRRNPEGHP